MPASARRKRADVARDLLRDARWHEFLEQLSEEYGGATVGLSVHDLNPQAGRVLEAVKMQPQYVESYGRYALGNPWLARAWRHEQGYFFLGEDIPVDRSFGDGRIREFILEWLLPQNLWKGMGAILFKDLERVPWIIAIAMLRPGHPDTPEIGRYTEPEKSRFLSLIPDMEEAILRHPFVRDQLPELKNTEDPPKGFRKKGRVRRPREKVVKEFKEYLVGNGLSKTAAEAAARALEHFLAEKKLVINPERPDEPPRPQPETDPASVIPLPPLPIEPA